MAIVFVKQATQVSIAGSSLTALTISLSGVGAGNCLVVPGAIYDANGTWTISGVTDGAETYTARAAVQTATTDRSRALVAWAVNVASGSHTASVNLSGTSGAGGRYYELGFLEYSGVATASAEDTWDANDDIASSSDASAGPITTTDAGDLLVGAISILGSNASLGLASPTSWTNRYRQNDANTTIGFDAGDWLPGSIQTGYTAQWSHSNTSVNETCGVVVALKPAGAPPPSTSLPMRSPGARIATLLHF